MSKKKKEYVLQFSNSGDYITAFPTIAAASKSTGDNASCISSCVTGKSKKTQNNYWHRTSDISEDNIQSISNNIKNQILSKRKRVLQYDCFGQRMQMYEDISEVKKNGYAPKYINQRIYKLGDKKCLPAYGYYWFIDSQLPVNVSEIIRNSNQKNPNTST